MVKIHLQLYIIDLLIQKLFGKRIRDKRAEEDSCENVNKCG